MIPENATEFPIANEPKLRGIANTRLDTFVDAAFAFGATVLLISSGDLPSTYSELIALLKDIPAFFLSFFTMMVFWLSHRSWSRRYGIEDKVTIPLTLLLVVSLLVYIYPLKLMYSTLLTFISGGYFPSVIQISTRAEGIGIIGFYGFGFALLASTMLGLYLRTLKLSRVMKFDDDEIRYVRSGISIWGVLVMTALLSGIIALLTPTQYGVWAGMVYILLPVLIPIVVTRVSKKGAILQIKKTPA